MLLMNGEAQSSSFVFLFLKPWQDILGIQASRRHLSPEHHCDTGTQLHELIKVIGAIYNWDKDSSL